MSQQSLESEIALKFITCNLLTINLEAYVVGIKLWKGMCTILKENVGNFEKTPSRNIKWENNESI